MFKCVRKIDARGCIRAGEESPAYRSAYTIFRREGENDFYFREILLLTAAEAGRTMQMWE